MNITNEIYAALSSEGKTRAGDWRDDGCWDLGGDDDMAAEDNALLGRYQIAWTAEHEAIELKRREAEATKLGISLAAVQKAEVLERMGESQREQVARTLRHYLSNGEGGELAYDCAQEISGIVDAIVEAAVAQTKAELIKEGGVK